MLTVYTGLGAEDKTITSLEALTYEPVISDFCFHFFPPLFY